jgi:hypothetical protein
MGEKAKIKKVVVSELFMDCYKHFNVYSQVERMNELSQRELYLLLILCLDKHDDENTVVRHNFLPFEKQIMEIFDVQDDKEVTNEVLLELVKETGDTYIETEYIVDSADNKVAEVYTKEQVRKLIKLGKLRSYAFDDIKSDNHPANSNVVFVGADETDSDEDESSDSVVELKQNRRFEVSSDSESSDTDDIDGI